MKARLYIFKNIYNYLVIFMLNRKSFLVIALSKFVVFIRKIVLNNCYLYLNLLYLFNKIWIVNR